MRISFLLHNGDAIGGTVRTTYNLARALAERHEVEVVSVFRGRDRPVFEPGADVRLRHLVDLRPESPDSAASEPEHARTSQVFAPEDHKYPQYSGLTDRLIGEYLGRSEADVVIGARPGLNVHLARQARPGAVRVGQEHLALSHHSAELRRTLRACYPRLDAVTTVTAADAEDYRGRLRLPGVEVHALPNSVPEPDVAPAGGNSPWVVAAGRLAPAKRYDMLIRAFAEVADERPDWGLRIYGAGREYDRLRRTIEKIEKIEKKGLYNHVLLMGAAHPIDPEWVTGSIAAVTSSLESFGMTIVEAMRCGLPVVATDCPHGPAEILRDGHGGVLAPAEDRAALVSALLRLINDDPLRRTMGRTALADAARFDPSRVGARYETLLEELTARRGRALHHARGALVGGAYAVTGTVKDAVKGTGDALQGGRTA